MSSFEPTIPGPLSQPLTDEQRSEGDEIARQFENALLPGKYMDYWEESARVARYNRNVLTKLKLRKPLPTPVKPAELRWQPTIPGELS